MTFTSKVLNGIYTSDNILFTVEFHTEMDTLKEDLKGTKESVRSLENDLSKLMRVMQS
jgi:hypothetical protein